MEASHFWLFKRIFLNFKIESREIAFAQILSILDGTTLK